MKTALSIAGSDSSGGAGIQADIKTMAANGVYAMTAITALTAQNTMGVTGILEVDPNFLESQIDAVFTDIRPDAVKIGMIPNAELMKVVAGKLRDYNAINVVVDPVMVATSGSVLMKSEALRTLREELLALCTVATPNIPEAEQLSGMTIRSKKDMEQAAKILADACHCAILLKGGHAIEDANDLLFQNGEMIWFQGKRIHNPNTHGTGCTLSSAIAANLAKGMALDTSIRRAKNYISGALQDGMDLGHSSGPLNHIFDLRSSFIQGESHEHTAV